MEGPLDRIEQPFATHRRERRVRLRLASGWGYLGMFAVLGIMVLIALSRPTTPAVGCAGMLLLCATGVVVVDVWLRLKAPRLRQPGWCVVDVPALLAGYPALPELATSGERPGSYRTAAQTKRTLRALRGTVRPRNWRATTERMEGWGARIASRVVTRHGGELICADTVNRLVVIGDDAVAWIDTEHVEIWNETWTADRPRRVDVWAGDEVLVYGHAELRRRPRDPRAAPADASRDEVLVLELAGTEAEPLVIVPLGPELAPAHGPDLKRVG